MQDSRNVFIVSRIGQLESPERKLADDWLEVIVEPVCRSMGIAFERADRITAPGRINDQVAKRLLTSDLVIADLTGLNPNVMFEVGVRYGLGLPIIQMASLGTVLPFDLMDMRTHFYDPTFNYRRTERTKGELAEAIPKALQMVGSAFTSLANDESDNHMNVTGTWVVEYPREQKHRRDVSIELYQYGDIVRGISTHIKTANDIYGDAVRTYALEGQVYNRFVQLTGRSPSPQRLLINCFLLEIVRDGQIMEGAAMAYSTVQGGIITSACKCMRA